MERYSVSLGYSPGAAAVHGNRAAAYIKLKMWAEAEQDCDTALQHDPAFVKAHVRRAAARLELGKADAALQVRSRAYCVPVCVCVMGVPRPLPPILR